ncbi:MOSC domain-containing protein [Rhodoferax sp.]|uniref:MOSC domain-containing protein n=1 Tax=Rhodoferax sp. TaxID=50421 RepID=UPI00261FC7B7|nr:MOSC domain-containing protein [Rhodoferax sp.]MDD2925113.1 MOSC domain-containing protein [Rhodoferax sp.]
MPQLLSVQVARARRVVIHDRSVLTAIHKQAVHGPVAVMPLGLEGDEQADLSVHGGLDKAVYAYPAEHYARWQVVRREAGLSGLQDTLPWGSVGENLTLQGLLETDVWVGDILRFANCALRVTQPREPCYKFNATMGFNTAAKVMAQQGCCGFYLAVKEPGSLQAGEDFELVAGPRRLSIPEMFRAKMFKHLR